VEKDLIICGFRIKTLCKTLWISCEEAAETRRITPGIAVGRLWRQISDFHGLAQHLVVEISLAYKMLLTCLICEAYVAPHQHNSADAREDK
jgi:hypothetical protein